MTLEDKVRYLSQILDSLMGTPCEQIRHADIIEAKDAELTRLRTLTAELVGALEALVELFQDTLIKPEMPQLDRARTVIAKARGESVSNTKVWRNDEINLCHTEIEKLEAINTELVRGLRSIYDKAQNDDIESLDGIADLASAAIAKGETYE